MASIKDKMINLINESGRPTHIFLSTEDHKEMIIQAMSRESFGHFSFGHDFGHSGIGNPLKINDVIVCGCDGPTHCATIGEL